MGFPREKARTVTRRIENLSHQKSCHNQAMCLTGCFAEHAVLRTMASELLETRHAGAGVQNMMNQETDYHRMLTTETAEFAEL